MLQITIPASEYYNDKTGEFITVKSQTLSLEHSLVSISKWESKWHKPFLSSNYSKTNEEIIDYVRCMTLTQNVDPRVYNNLTEELFIKINNYCDDSMTATWFSDDNKPTKKSNEVLTSELIYYYMFCNNIPMECQKWHINRLITLIRVCSIKNAPPKKMSQQELRARQRKMNNARRKKLHTTG